MIAALPGQAMPQDLPIAASLAESPAARADRRQALDLRLPPSAGRLPQAAMASIPQPRNSTLRLEPRKSYIEQGVDGSREALIACQRGAYPGATVAASSVQTTAGDAQPDHCYRF
ncbi:MAG: hypothetical protein HY020_02375 [Burkholderiales bacterium]|nr:hypothetical protein [Burkholderiales bacterium]